MKSRKYVTEPQVCFVIYSPDPTNAYGVRGGQFEMVHGLKVVKSCSGGGALLVYLFSLFFCRMYRLATMHFVTERRTEGSAVLGTGRYNFQPLHRPLAFKIPHAQNSQRSTKKNAYATWRALCSRDVRADRIMKKVKVKTDIAPSGGNPTSELRDFTCHVGSHSVTCHPHKRTRPA